MVRKAIEFDVRADMARYMARTGIVDLEGLVEGRITPEMETHEYEYDGEDHWMHSSWLVDHYDRLGFFDDGEEEDDQ